MIEQKGLKFHKKEILLLQIIVSLIFLGRAWQGLFWDIPLRSLLWDQHLMEGMVLGLGWEDWRSYATSRTVNGFINGLNFSLGLFWLLCAGLLWGLDSSRKWLRWPLYLGAFSLFILALLYWKEKHYSAGQLFEYAAQIGSPLILVHLLLGGQNSPKFRLVVKVLIGTTFICHGLYAVGYYPVPGFWIQWCMDMFWLADEANSIIFLKVIGILDFAAAVCLFFPKIWVLAIWYCIVWGLLTALARIVSNFYIEFPVASLHQWWHETAFRLVHGGLPFLLWMWQRRQNNSLFVPIPKSKDQASTSFE